MQVAYPRAGRAWKDTEDLNLYRYWSIMGLPAHVIADLFARSKESIRYRVRYKGYRRSCNYLRGMAAKNLKGLTWRETWNCK